MVLLEAADSHCLRVLERAALRSKALNEPSAGKQERSDAVKSPGSRYDQVLIITTQRVIIRNTTRVL